jgi:hypothetical protein
MTQFRTRRHGQRFPLRDNAIKVGNLEAVAKQDKNRGIKEKIVEETRKVEIKDPENKLGGKPKNETIVVQEKEIDVNLDVGKMKSS